MSRGVTPVVEFSTPLDAVDRPLQEALDTIRSAFGHVADLVAVAFIAVPAGHSLTAAVAPGSSINARTALDLSDVNIDEARVVVYGSSAVNAATLQIYDLTNSVAICSVSVGVPGALYTGAWTAVRLKGGERSLEVRVIGDGVNSQTLYSVHLQLRTSKFRS